MFQVKPFNVISTLRNVTGTSSGGTPNLSKFWDVSFCSRPLVTVCARHPIWKGRLSTDLLREVKVNILLIKMPEGRGIDLNGDTLSRETKEAQSPLKSENSQPKRRSPLRPCKVENIDDDIDTGSQPNGQPDSQPNSQPRQGEIGGPSTNGSDTKSRTKSNSDKFLEALETRFRSRCEVRFFLIRNPVFSPWIRFTLLSGHNHAQSSFCCIGRFSKNHAQP